MKIMILGTIRGKKQIEKALNKIVESLDSKQFSVYHEHLTKKSQSNLDNSTKEDDLKFHKKILKNIKLCDIVIAECSFQSMSVGYLISYATEQNKPVILFYKKDAPKPNLFPTLTQTGKLFLVKYDSIERIPNLLKEYIAFAKDQQDTRFNFFISPKHISFLDWVAKTKKVPRSVYLRKLIEKEIKLDPDYLLK
jgi:2'-deoxynucleoside 5'-phosphate N-hydrolase